MLPKVCVEMNKNNILFHTVLIGVPCNGCQNFKKSSNFCFFHFFPLPLRALMNSLVAMTFVLLEKSPGSIPGVCVGMRVVGSAGQLSKAPMSLFTSEQVYSRYSVGRLL